METEISDFVEKMKLPPSKFGIRELRKREETWRALWSWIDDEVKYYVLRAGSTMRILKRDYKAAIGEVGSVKFKIDEIELIVYDKSYNYTDGKYYFESKVLKIPASAIMMQEFILDSELVEEVVPEVMGLGDEALALT